MAIFPLSGVAAVGATAAPAYWDAKLEATTVNVLRNFFIGMPLVVLQLLHPLPVRELLSSSSYWPRVRELQLCFPLQKPCKGVWQISRRFRSEEGRRARLRRPAFGLGRKAGVKARPRRRRRSTDAHLKRLLRTPDSARRHFGPLRADIQGSSIAGGERGRARMEIGLPRQ